MTSTAPDVSTPAGILRLGNAFCDAKALLTAVELDLFGFLHAAPATEEEIRRALGLAGRGLGDLLRLLVSLRLLERDGNRLRNAAGADRYLVKEQPGYLGGFLLRASRNLYPAWGRLNQALRTGEKQTEGDFAFVLANQPLLRQFVGMMDALTQQLGPALAEAFDWGAHSTVLDVGGCRGNMAAQLVKAHPHLNAHVFDLPQLAPLFAELVQSTGLASSLSFTGGDFFTDPLPTADVVVLGHVLHDWDERQRAALVAKAYAAVRPGGALLVYDRMLEDGPNLVENLVISLDMLLVTDGGSEYPADEVHRHAAAAGCTSVTTRPLGDYDTLVICAKD